MTILYNLARIIGVLSIVVALAGCSAIRLGYNNLPEVAYWWADGYVDFEDGQTPRAREDLARLHQWHRATELPRLAQLLQRVETMAAGPVTPPQLCALVPDLRARLQAVAERAEPALVTTALSLAPAQLQHLERKYARNNAEFRKEWVQLSAADLLDKRAKQITDRAEMIYGDLNEAQRAALRQHLERSAFDPQRSLAERQRRQQDTLVTLRRVNATGVALDDARSQIRSLVERLTLPADAEMRSRQEAMTQESCQLFAAVHNAAGPVQRERAIKRLQGYQRDLQALAQPQ